MGGLVWVVVVRVPLYVFGGLAGRSLPVSVVWINCGGVDVGFWCVSSGYLVRRAGAAGECDCNILLPRLVVWGSGGNMEEVASGMVGDARRSSVLLS